MTEHEERFYNIAAFLTKCHLTWRESLILMLRKFCYMTLQEIADDYGLCRERIRQIEAEGIRKIRASVIGNCWLKK